MLKRCSIESQKLEKNMPNELSAVRDFAQTVRYSGDNLTANEAVKRSNDQMESYFSLNSMLVSPLVTPIIHKSIEKVIKRLGIPTTSIKAFVYASPEIQAECHAGNDVDCIIRLSSGLIDILENKEIEFVIGHEIGHFIYGHGLASAYSDNKSLEFSIQKRSQEISADRIGLLASESLDNSIRAMMKTMSGLSTKYLKFDIGAFLSQLSNNKNISQLDVNSSHPSMIVRCRALLWFSMSETFKSGKRDYQLKEVDKLNKRIKADIDKFDDSIARDKIEDLKRNIALWLCAEKIVEDGAFDNHEQKIFQDMFGQDMLKKLKNFLSSQDSATSIGKSVSEKLEIARRDLQNELPSTFENEMEQIEKAVSSNFV